MEKDKIWLLLCKPCSVTLKKLPDSVINKWRRRTTQHHRPYASRKRSGDQVIYDCRLLRPKRKLQYSRDAIDCIPYPYDDEDEKEEYGRGAKEKEKINLDELSLKSHNSLLLPNINEDDSINPVWKYKRRMRKNSPHFTNKIDDINNHQLLIQSTLQNLKYNEKNETKVKVQIHRELRLILWKLEDVNDDDYLNAWKFNNSRKISNQFPLNNESHQENILNNNLCKLKMKRKLHLKTFESNSNMNCVLSKVVKEIPDENSFDTSTNLQKYFTETSNESLINTQKEKSNISNGVKKVHENKILKLVNNDDSFNDQLIIDVENNEETTTVMTFKSDTNINSDASTLIICSCHSGNRLKNEWIVQIEMVLYCEICNTLFRRSECFEVHYRYSSKCNNERGKGRLPKLFCSTCRTILHSLSDMRKHLEEHANINFHRTVTFVCNICRVVFFGVGTVFCTHWFTHEKDSTFVASRYSFPKLCVSNQGIKPAGAGTNEQYLFVAEYVCRLCKSQFTSDGELSKHSCEHSLQNSEGKKKNQIEKKLHAPMARESEFTISKASELSEKDYINGLEQVSAWNCGFCNKTFSTWTEFEKHCVNHLQVIKYPGYLCVPRENDQPAYICNICRHVSSNLTNLMKHWASHDIIKFICNYCDEKCSTLKLFIVHIRLSCWKFKSSCSVVLNNQQSHPGVFKAGFENLQEILQYDHKSNNADNMITNIKESKKISKKSFRAIKVRENVTIFNTSDSHLNNSITNDLLGNQSTVNLDKNELTLSNQATINMSNCSQRILKSISSEKQVTSSNVIISNSMSSSTNLLSNTPIDFVNDNPVQLVSLIMDESGNIQVIPNNTGISIATNGSTFQGPQVITNGLPILNNSNEIITTSGIGPVVNKLVIKVVNNGQNSSPNNQTATIVEQPRLITPINDFDKNKKNETNQEDFLSVRSQAKGANNELVEKNFNVMTVSSKNVRDSMIVDLSSSDHDSEIFVEKICTSSENNHVVDTLKDNLTKLSKKIDDEVKIIGTSPSKNNSNPRPFLRVKDFSELQAVKNHTCNQCRAAFDNETSLNEHLNAHMNRLNKKNGNPTMRAALVLPVTEAASSESPTHSKVTQVASNILSKRILPSLPQRVRNVNARIAMPLKNHGSTEERANINVTAVQTKFSCSLCHFWTTKEEEFRQHLALHCNEALNNTQDVSTGVSDSNQSRTISSIANASQIENHFSSFLPTSTVTSVDTSKNRPKMFNCNLCSFTTLEKNDIIIHVATHCTRPSQTTAFVQNHNEVQQSSVYYPAVNTNAASSLYPVYTCSTCLNFKTDSCEELNQHIRNTHLISQKFTNYFCCNQCKLYFTNDETLKNHMNTYHINFCKVCLRRFEDYTDFVNHLCCPQRWK